LVCLIFIFPIYIFELIESDFSLDGFTMLLFAREDVLLRQLLAMIPLPDFIRCVSFRCNVFDVLLITFSILIFSYCYCICCVENDFCSLTCRFCNICQSFKCFYEYYDFGEMDLTPRSLVSFVDITSYNYLNSIHIDLGEFSSKKAMKVIF
jgi:hypothetical protein